MANANVARGLIPVRRVDGGYWNGSCRVYHVPASDSTALFKGDVVKFVTDASDANGIQTVTRAAAGDTNLLGVMMGLSSAGQGGLGASYAVTRDTTVYRAASTLAYVLVCDDWEVLFEAQEDGVGGVMTVGAVGRNADIIVGTGSTTSGYSGTMIDSSTLGTGTANLRVMEAVERADNDPTLDYAKWLVMILEHQMRTTTGT